MNYLEKYKQYPEGFLYFHDWVMHNDKIPEEAKFAVEQAFLKDILKPMQEYIYANNRTRPSV